MDHRLIALVCHGNGYLAGKRWHAQPSDFSTENGDFHFVRGRDGAPDEEIATSPEGFFVYPAANGALGLRIASTPDAQDHGRVWMMNGVVEAAEVIFPGNESEFWISYLDFPDQPGENPAGPQPFPRLDVSTVSQFASFVREAVKWPALQLAERIKRAHAAHSAGAQPQKTWKYMFRMQERGPSENAAPPDLDALTQALRETLTGILDFARRNNADPHFIEAFRGALDILDGRTPPTQTDIAPQGVLPPQAIRLLSAGTRAWQFGGMSSWNDSPYPPPGDPLAAKQAEDEYRRATDALYMAITKATIGAANSSCRSSALRSLDSTKPAT